MGPSQGEADHSLGDQVLLDQDLVDLGGGLGSLQLLAVQHLHLQLLDGLIWRDTYVIYTEI